MVGKQRVVIISFVFFFPQVWDISDVIRLQSHSVPADALYLVWKESVLLTAPQYSGIIQVYYIVPNQWRGILL